MSNNSTPTESKFMSMLFMQENSNSYLAGGADWRSNNNNWNRAIWIECAELMEHYGNWKWWKANKEPDIDQCFLECVDIWHFILSRILQRHSYASIECSIEYWGSIFDGNTTPQNFHQHVEDLAYGALIATPDDKEVLQDFDLVLRSLGKNFTDLYKWYIGKNALNMFRKKNGYKEGRYIKVWNGREDNEHLAEFLNEFTGDEEDFSEKIWERLQTRYNESTANN